MIALCYLLAIFLSLAFLVSICNCLNQNTINRFVEVLVSVVIFIMILGLFVFINTLKYGG